MTLIYMILIGLCAGWLAGQFTKGGGFGLVGNLIVGVVGSLVGGFLFSILGLRPSSVLGELIVATVGSVVLLAILRAVTNQQGRRRR
jgi:uncharacterized membrane protein YeaQ/YmgE (transglycosylase-associated protein family)